MAMTTSLVQGKTAKLGAAIACPTLSSLLQQQSDKNIHLIPTKIFASFLLKKVLVMDMTSCGTTDQKLCAARDLYTLVAMAMTTSLVQEKNAKPDVLLPRHTLTLLLPLLEYIPHSSQASSHLWKMYVICCQKPGTAMITFATGITIVIHGAANNLLTLAVVEMEIVSLHLKIAGDNVTHDGPHPGPPLHPVPQIDQPQLSCKYQEKSAH